MDNESMFDGNTAARVQQLEEVVRQQKMSILQQEVAQLRNVLRFGGDAPTGSKKVTLPPLDPVPGHLALFRPMAPNGSPPFQVAASQSAMGFNRPGHLEAPTSHTELLNTVAHQRDLLEQQRQMLENLQQQAAGEPQNAGRHPLQPPAPPRGNQTVKVSKPQQKAAAQKWCKSASVPETQKSSAWPMGDPSRWEFKSCDGYEIALCSSNTIKPIEVETKEHAISMVRDAPNEYFGCSFSQPGWGGKPKVYLRSCKFYKSGFIPNTRQPEATAAMKAIYHMLPEDVTIEPDAYTDTVLSHYQGKLMSSKCPGRGQGVLDKPGLKVVQDINPRDVDQGGVGDCWLLSAISAMAEFDKSISTLFKKRRDLHKPPKDTFNKYVVQLYDLKTWKPVNVVVDERLIWDDGAGDLLGAKASGQGDLWPLLLEKAVAAHCGGWDKIDGGQCTHAWRILTGCKEVYTISHDGSKYTCAGAYNPNDNRWEELANSPHDGFKGLWPMKWPEVGGGGGMDDAFSQDELFSKMCAWDRANFIMGAGTKSGTDTEMTDGIVDGHAYTVLSCIKNAGGSGIDMVKMRNPWGSQEFQKGGWVDGGPNWQKYPKVFQACGRPIPRDDGVFWIQKETFFKYFVTVYLCAQDMAHFVTKPKSAHHGCKKKKPFDVPAAPKEETSKWEFEPKDGWQINLCSSNKTDPVEVDTKEEAIHMVKSHPKTFFGCQWIQEGYSGKAKVFPRSCIFYQGGFAENDHQPDATGAMKATYQMLPKDVTIQPDRYTDGCLAQYNGRRMSSKCPGRGQGVFDHPGLKIVEDINPGDVCQGGVGDCWLLSALSALAEFDDAITVLFKKRRDLHLPPKDTFNQYTIELYDLTTFRPVDVVIDERLIWDDQSGDLLSCKPGKAGDLWPALIEKALAAHCGGWDKIDGGQCTHAWRLLTGCKEVYTLRKEGNEFKCYGAYNPNEEKWEKLANSPHDGFQGLWPMKWPDVGGGGGMDQGLSQDEFFLRMCAWDDNNFIMGGGTRAGSDTNNTNGIVDGHAYTVLSCVDNAGGEGFDMVKVRNPWGQQEFECGDWTDSGPNWERYPKVYEACGRPVKKDDGIFWMQKENFFNYFSTIYLCAHDMAEFVNK